MSNAFPCSYVKILLSCIYRVLRIPEYIQKGELYEI
nr:MAG TPA: hypothetical protein [Caudoviricetes sp.]